MKIFYTPRSERLLFFVNIWHIIILSLAKKSYDGYAIYNVQASNESQLEFLHRMWSTGDDRDVDFWHEPFNTDDPIEVLVSPRVRSNFEKDLMETGVLYNISNSNVQKVIDAEAHRDISAPKPGTMQQESYFNFSQYNGWTEIEQYLQKLPISFPDLVHIETIGQSHEGRDLILVKIGSQGNAEQTKKPAVWIDAGIHAREWVSTASVLYIIDSILNYYEGDETVHRYLDSIDWYFLPMMNPDGFVFSYTKDRMWRKNRSPEICKGRNKCCQGVDLNRNFATHWGGNGASKNPCSDVFAGAKAFSEPESRAVRDFVLTHTDRLKAFFTFHSYGQIWLHPYGYKKRTYPEDVEELRKLSNAAVDNIKSVHGTKFKVGTAANILYPASGGSDDWAKAEAGIKYVYAVELRPLVGRGNGFLLHPRNIIPSGEEMWAGIRAVADRILSKYGGEDGSVATTTSEPAQKTTVRKLKPATLVTRPTTAKTTTPEDEEEVTETVEEEEAKTGEPCYDLSSRCAYIEEDDSTGKCENNVVKAICRKLCKQC